MSSLSMPTFIDGGNTSRPATIFTCFKFRYIIFLTVAIIATYSAWHVTSVESSNGSVTSMKLFDQTHPALSPSPTTKKSIETPIAAQTILYGGESWTVPRACSILPVSNAIVRPPNGQVSNETDIYSFGKWYWEKHHPSISLPKPMDQPILSLVQIYNNFFQHIVFDTLPKLTRVCPFLLTDHPNVQVLVMNVLQRDLVMEACPLPKHRFLLFQTAIRAPIVYVPHFAEVNPHHALQMGIVPPRSVRPLGPTTPGTEVVYLSRAPGTIRSVANEEEVVAVLRTQWPHLRVVKPTNDWRVDRLSVQNASVVIGPHGGAMANMVFAPMNTTVIEFTPLVRYKQEGRNERPCYFGLAHGLGFEYYAVEPLEFDFDRGSMLVSIDRMEYVLNQMAGNFIEDSSQNI